MAATVATTGALAKALFTKGAPWPPCQARLTDQAGEQDVAERLYYLGLETRCLPRHS